MLILNEQLGLWHRRSNRCKLFFSYVSGDGSYIVKPGAIDPHDCKESAMLNSLWWELGNEGAWLSFCPFTHMYITHTCRTHTAEASKQRICIMLMTV